MKKICFLLGLACLLVASEASAEPRFGRFNPLVGRWSCWHDPIENTDGLWLPNLSMFNVNNLLADASIMSDGRYLFQAIQSGGNQFNNEDRVQYGGMVYATFNGNSVHIDIPNSPYAKTASATLSVERHSDETRYFINGDVVATIQRTVAEIIPSADGGEITVPRVIMDEVPVKFYCEKVIRVRSD